MWQCDRPFMAKKKLSPNATRRAAARAREKLADASEKLAKLEPGGSPANPLELESASLVEPHARGTRCVRCGSEVRVIADRYVYFTFD